MSQDSTRNDERSRHDEDDSKNIGKDKLEVTPAVTTDMNEYDEVTKLKMPYPKAVGFIVVNEFCERFSFYGLRTVLSLYLRDELNFSSDTSTVIFHIFIMFCYFFPILGAIVADSWLGKFRTIFYLSIVYAIGNMVVSTAAVPDLIPPQIFTMIGLILIALGTGGIKPCVSAFGGDQFILPHQEDQLQKFFSLFYFAINCGSFASTILTPILREDVKCFGKNTCYSLAFGVPAILMITSLVIFVIGKPWYKMKNPEGNVIIKVSKCIWHGITSKVQISKDEHWLYKAQDKFDRKFIEDVIAALRVLFLYIPLPIFWALFDQQGSRWTFQATRMNVDIGGLKVKPDQMQVVNPVIILLFIPLFESVIYPLCAKCGLLTRPLQRLTVGGLLAAAAFGVSALVEMELEKTYPVLPHDGEGQLRIINAMGNDTKMQLNMGSGWGEEIPFTRDKIYTDLHVPVKGMKVIELKLEKTFKLEITEKKATSFAFFEPNNSPIVIEHSDVDKSEKGDPKLLIIVSDPPSGKESFIVSLVSDYNKFEFNFNTSQPYLDMEAFPTNDYKIIVDDKELGSIFLGQGGIYSLVISKSGLDLVEITEPNSVSILWMIPQYVLLTAGEVMFSVTGLEFSFTQAPVSMKSLMQAAWLFNVAVGNLLVAIIAEMKIFQSQMYEFLLFGALMFIDMTIFALMAMKYTYVEAADNSDKELELEASKEKDSQK